MHLLQMETDKGNLSGVTECEGRIYTHNDTEGCLNKSHSQTNGQKTG